MRFSDSKLPEAKKRFVVGVGARVYVNWTPPTGGAQPVPMLDAEGRVLANDLRDGQELEVLSWRPRSRDGLAYEVRRISDGSEWWIEATYLRRRAAPQPAASSSGAAPGRKE